MNPDAHLRGRLNKQAGQTAENIVEIQLRGMGIEVEQIETGWRVMRRPRADGNGTQIVGATPMAKVLGDLFGVQQPSGRAILVESKHDDGDRLSLSELKDHQRSNLLRWHRAGALCFVAWVRFEPVVEVCFIHFPSVTDEWRKGSPLPIERARQLDRASRAALTNAPPPGPRT